MDSLYVWSDSRFVGRFDRNGDDVAFSYAEGAFPISLSLPLTGGWLRKAPIRFLDNLLPVDFLPTAEAGGFPCLAARVS